MATAFLLRAGIQPVRSCMHINFHHIASCTDLTIPIPPPCHCKYKAICNTISIKPAGPNVWQSSKAIILTVRENFKADATQR